MDCEKLRPLIGPWLDRELAPDQAALLSHHLETCRLCEEEHRILESLARSLTWDNQREGLPDADSMWERIFRSPASKPSLAQTRRTAAGWLLAAAAAFVALGMGAFLSRTGSLSDYAPTGKAPLLHLDSYAEALARGEAAAERWEAQYSGRESDAAEAALLPSKLAPGFSRARVRVLTLRCCRAFRATYRRNGQTLYVIFDAHPHSLGPWSGERKLVLENTSYRSLAKNGLRCLAPWQPSGLAVIGAFSEGELVLLLKQFENRIGGRRSA